MVYTISLLYCSNRYYFTLNVFVHHLILKNVAKVCSNFPSGNGFTRKSSAPAPLKSALDSVLTTAVRAMIGCLLDNFPVFSRTRISRVAVTPSLMGID